jgi:hypothetical protein
MAAIHSTVPRISIAVDIPNRLPADRRVADLSCSCRIDRDSCISDEADHLEPAPGRKPNTSAETFACQQPVPPLYSTPYVRSSRKRWASFPGYSR